MLLPPAYIAVRKSVGVWPLLLAMAVPSTGWMMRRGAEGERERPGQDEQDQDDGAAEREHGPAAAAGGLGQPAEEPPRPEREPPADDAGAEAGVEHRQEDVEQGDQNQQGAERLLRAGKHQASSADGRERRGARRRAFRRGSGGAPGLPGGRPGPRTAEQADHRLVEGRDVVGLAARHEVAVHDGLLVDPLRAGFSRSVCSDGQDASRRPRAAPASMRVHGPWQIVATGLPASKNAFANVTAVRLHPQRVGVDDTAGQEQRVEVPRPGAVERDVDRVLVAPLGELPGSDAVPSWVRRCWSPRRPASSAFLGSVISTCSKPSVTRIATFMPSRLPSLMAVSPRVVDCQAWAAAVDSGAVPSS